MYFLLWMLTVLWSFLKTVTTESPSQTSATQMISFCKSSVNESLVAVIQGQKVIQGPYRLIYLFGTVFTKTFNFLADVSQY